MALSMSCALFCVLASASAQAAPINAIENLRVKETASHTEIHVEGSQTPTFTVFKLEDPIRLFIDMPNTNLKKVDGTLAIRNGVIDHVGTLQFKKGSTPIGRIIVMLSQDSLYKVVSEGNNVVIRVDGKSRSPMTLAAGETGAASGVHKALEAERSL